MKIYTSRFEPSLKNGENVLFGVGEVVRYRTRTGEEFDITITSEPMTNSGEYGYEAIFSDDNKKYFALAKSIVGWDGKGGLPHWDDDSNRAHGVHGFH